MTRQTHCAPDSNDAVPEESVLRGTIQLPNCPPVRFIISSQEISHPRPESGDGDIIVRFPVLYKVIDYGDLPLIGKWLYQMCREEITQQSLPEANMEQPLKCSNPVTGMMNHNKLSGVTGGVHHPQPVGTLRCGDYRAPQLPDLFMFGERE